MNETPSSVVAAEQVLAKGMAVLDSRNSLVIASTGGPQSPWVLSVYFARTDAGLVLFLEESGKTLANVRAHAQVAFMSATEDATQDFVQGAAVATLLPEAEADAVRAALLARMPWYQTYTPVVPVLLQPTRMHVASFASGWFPAKVWNAGA